MPKLLTDDCIVPKPYPQFRLLRIATTVRCVYCVEALVYKEPARIFSSRAHRRTLAWDFRVMSVQASLLISRNLALVAYLYNASPVEPRLDDGPSAHTAVIGALENIAVASCWMLQYEWWCITQDMGADFPGGRSSSVRAYVAVSDFPLGTNTSL